MIRGSMGPMDDRKSPHPKDRVVGALSKWAFHGLHKKGGDPNYLLAGMILQVMLILRT